MNTLKEIREFVALAIETTNSAQSYFESILVKRNSDTSIANEGEYGLILTMAKAFEYEDRELPEELANLKSRTLQTHPEFADMTPLMDKVEITTINDNIPNIKVGNLIAIYKNIAKSSMTTDDQLKVYFELVNILNSLCSHLAAQVDWDKSVVKYTNLRNVEDSVLEDLITRWDSAVSKMLLLGLDDTCPVNKIMLELDDGKETEVYGIIGQFVLPTKL